MKFLIKVNLTFVAGSLGNDLENEEYLGGASGCLTYGDALLDQCMEEVQQWKVAQYDGDGYAALIELLGGHAVTWFPSVQEVLSV